MNDYSKLTELSEDEFRGLIISLIQDAATSIMVDDPQLLKGLTPPQAARFAMAVTYFRTDVPFKMEDTSVADLYMEYVGLDFNEVFVEAIGQMDSSLLEGGTKETMGIRIFMYMVFMNAQAMILDAALRTAHGEPETPIILELPEGYKILDGETFYKTSQEKAILMSNAIPGPVPIGHFGVHPAEDDVYFSSIDKSRADMLGHLLNKDSSIYIEGLTDDYGFQVLDLHKSISKGGLDMPESVMVVFRIASHLAEEYGYTDLEIAEALSRIGSSEEQYMTEGTVQTARELAALTATTDFDELMEDPDNVKIHDLLKETIDLIRTYRSAAE